MACNKDVSVVKELNARDLVKFGVKIKSWWDFFCVVFSVSQYFEDLCTFNLILLDFPIHIDTISMGLSIIDFNEPLVGILKKSFVSLKILSMKRFRP